MAIVLRTSNWLIVWIGFELSVLGFLPMFITNKLSIERIVKYLLLQAGGSALIIISFLTFRKSSPLFLLRIALKIGVFPFFQWVPVLMASIRWARCFVLSTLQKVGPILILGKLELRYRYTVYLLGGLGIWFRGVLGINQTKLRPLIGYSSIAHTSWIVMSVIFNVFRYVFIYIGNLLYVWCR